MGLDITAHEKMERLDSEAEARIEAYRNGGKWDGPECDDYEEALHVEDSEHFPGRCEGLAQGWYSRNPVHRFRAGSYSGYNIWRDQLSRAALGKSAAQVYEDEPDLKGPFVELINFSDCEGCIGPTVSAKLALDFAEHRERVRQAVEFDRDGAYGAYFMERYDAWAKAFEIAARGGVVKFQ